MRYLKRLENRDLSLVHAMIPLGSCTMKLNAAAELAPISWPRFAGAASLRAGGAGARVCRDDRGARARRSARSPACRGSRSSRIPERTASTPGCSRSATTTPRAARASRDVCLIPASAHGTNPASAAMAGLQGRRRGLRHQRQRRRRGPEAQARRQRRPGCRAHDHLSLDARRVRSPRRARSARRRISSGAARSTWTAPTSTRSPASPTRRASARTFATSICTRPSASPTAAAARAWGRSRLRRTSRRTCPAIPACRGRRGASPTARWRRRHGAAR